VHACFERTRFIVETEIRKTYEVNFQPNFCRISSPAFMLVNHDGQNFPEIYRKDGDGEQPLRYDRIVCDVPCSGKISQNVA